MIVDQYSAVRILPISAGWEFMRRPVQRVLSADSISLIRLAKRNQWQFTPELRQAIDRPGQAVVVTNRGYLIEYVNTLFVQMTGYEQKDSLGRRPDFLQGIDTDQATRRRIGVALSHGQIAHETLLNYRQSGEPYLCDLTIFPVLNHEQELINFIAFEQETAQ